MVTTYSNEIPSLENLKPGDSVMFGDKLSWQSPDAQKLIGAGAANWNYDANNNPISLTMNKPYVAPTTGYVPSSLYNLYNEASAAYKPIDTTPYQDLLNTQQQALLAKQAELGKYDVGTQEAVYGLEGQGRGITSGLVAGQQEKLQRQRSLQRLGMAQDVENLQNQYQFTQSNINNLLETQKYNQQQQQNRLTTLIGLAERIKNDETAAQEKKDEAAKAVADEEKEMVLNGYKKLKPSDLKNYKETDIIRLPNGDIWSNKQSVDSGIVLDLMTKYRDAGIKTSDSLEIAQAKMLKSKIYQDEIRGPVGSSGSNVDESAAINLYSGIMQQAIEAGAKTPDEVLAGAQAYADSTGVTLNLKQLNALKIKAQELLAGYKPVVAPVSKDVVKVAPYQQQGLGVVGTNLPTYLNALDETINKYSPTGWSQNIAGSISKYLFGK